MVCLVGENPLPIYLGIQQFAMDDAEIVFVHSEETKDAANAIEKQMGGARKRIAYPKLNDPYDPKELSPTMDGLKKIYPDAGLNYTGGTKVMSAFAVRSWYGDLTNAFYLEEARGLFHFGDGSTEKLTDFRLKTVDLCRLHDVKKENAPWSPPAEWEDIQRIWFRYKGVRPYPPHQVNRYEFQKAENQAKWREFLGVLTDETRAKWDAVPVPESNNKYKQGTRAGQNFGIYERMVEFAATKWLERLVECLVKQLVPGTQVVPSWYFRIEGQQFESDGMVVRNSRLYYFSATTSDTESACKGKLFEAAYRARQIGGGLARACVVSLANKDQEGNDICANCNASLNDPHFKVFGKSHVTAWMDGDTSTLEEFLNS
jgi:hypothetical protein